MTAVTTQSDSHGMPNDANGAPSQAEHGVVKPFAHRRAARVSFIGTGPGDLGLLTMRAVELLGVATDVVVTSDSHHALINRYCHAAAKVVRVDPGDASAIAAALHVAASPGRFVVRLLSGDGASFGRLGEEVGACRNAGIGFEIIPGVSPAAAVPAFAGVSTVAEGVNTVHVVDTSRGEVDLTKFNDSASTLVLQGSRAQLAKTCADMLKSGSAADAQVVITANGSTIRQHTSELSLKLAATELKKADDNTWPGDLVAVIGPGVAHRERASWFETKPLFGWRVLVPRTQQQSEPMCQQLSEYGAYCDVVPTISVEPPRTPHQLEKAVKGLVTGRYHWIGFTSVNAVKAIREKFEVFGLDARSFAGIKVAAVGGVTAQALREWGIEPDLVPTDSQSAQGLLEAWPPFDDMLDPINRVFMPRADIATDSLIAGLQEIGWEVDDITAYRTVRASPPAAEIRDAIKSGQFDAVLFTSSSTVRNLVGIAGKPHQTTVIACIGPATAEAAEKHGLRVDVMAQTPSSETLIDALAEFGAGMRETAISEGKPVRRPSQRRPASRRRSRVAK